MVGIIIFLRSQEKAIAFRPTIARGLALSAIFI